MQETYKDINFNELLLLVDKNKGSDYEKEIIKGAEKIFNNTAKHMDVLMKQLPVMMWTVDMDLRFTSFLGADRSQFNQDPSNMIGKTIYDAYERNDSEFKPIEAHQKALLGESSNFEIFWNNKYFLVFLEPLKDDNNNIVGALRLGVDITEQKKIEQELLEAKKKAEELNKIKSSFLANMSHELRTPMVGILGYADLLKNELSDPEYKDMASTVYSSGLRLMETLNLILELTKLESNQIKLEVVNLNLKSIIDEVLVNHTKIADKKNIKLSVEYLANQIYFMLDEKIIKQILNNLLHNAIKYTEKGYITVRVDTFNENSLIIVVEDTGIGIPEEFHETIFEEFRQVSEGLNRNYEGTGLGLTLTKRFLEKLNGTISVESTIGIGSKFTIIIPQIKVDKMTDNKLNVENKMEEIKTDRLHEVLLVEDDPISQNIIKIFTKGFCNITWAKNGDEALHECNSKIFDAILMDINLGRGLSGIDCTKEIRYSSLNEKVPIIAVTAFAMKGDKEEFINSGCSHYISKPFNKQSLLDLLNNIFEKK